MSWEAAAILGIVALIILFGGEPDLHDAWLNQLGACTAAEATEETP